MTTNELKEMISIFYDMELNNYMMQNCMKQLKGDMAKLGHKRNIPEPVYTVESIEQKEPKFGDDVGLCFTLCLVIGIISGCVYAFKEGDGAELILAVPILAVIFGVVGAIAGAIIGMLVHAANLGIADKKNREKENEIKQNAMTAYNSQRMRKQMEYQAFLKRVN